MTTTHALRVGVAAIALLGLAACGKKDEAKTDTTTTAMAPPPAATPTPVPSIATIEIGKHVGANLRVVSTDSTFAPSDTIYLSVVTEHAMPASSLIAKWTLDNGTLVDSTMQAVAPADPVTSQSVTQFHVAKAKGLASGKYKVELWLDGVSSGTREVVVKK